MMTRKEQKETARARIEHGLKYLQSVRESEALEVVGSLYVKEEANRLMDRVWDYDAVELIAEEERDAYLRKVAEIMGWYNEKNT